MHHIHGLAFAILAACLFPHQATAQTSVPKVNWTGPYLGTSLGYGWGEDGLAYTANDEQAIYNIDYCAPLAPAGTCGTAPPINSLRYSGILGGPQIGYNHQLTPKWLIGVESDIGWTGIKGSQSLSGLTLGAGGAPYAQSMSTEVSWFGTVRGRLGFLPVDNLLTYVTGGLAYGRVAQSGTYALPPGSGAIAGFGGTCPAGLAPCYSGSANSTTAGWAIGGGFEYGLLKNWSLKAEYLYVNLDSKSLNETATIQFGGNALSSFNAKAGDAAFNVVRVGVNYHFN